MEVKLFFGVGGIIAAFPAGALHAQSGTTASVPYSSGTSTPAASSVPADNAVPAASEPGIADIIVTATRREERLQRIPVTVTAVTGAALTGAGVTDTRTLTQVVPGLNFSRQGAVSQPSIRGVGSAGVSNGDESNVATYVDGVYQADPYSTMLDLVQVKRVEVLRGPQGTVFGRNATGGLINVLTEDPKFDFSGNVSGSYGRMRNDAALYDLRGYVTAPVTSNVAIDFAGLYRHSDGYIRNIVTGGTLGKETVFDVRNKILVKLAGSNQVIFTTQYGRQDAETIIYEIRDNNTTARNFPGVILPDGPYQSSRSELPIYDWERFSESIRSSFDLGGVRLETTGAYIKSSVTQLTDNDGTNLSITSSQVDYSTRVLSQEVRLLSDNSGPFSWLMGIYVFDLASNGTIAVSNSPLVGGVRVPGPLTTTVFAPRVKTRSHAGFAEGTHQIGDRLFVTAGGRYTTERRRFVQTLNGRITIPDASRTFNKFTYRVAARFQASRGINIYGSYGTGFKSGVFNVVTAAITPANPGVVNPETIKAAEIGIKTDLTSRLRVNLSAYHYRYGDLQLQSRAIDNSVILQNATTAKSYGGEAEVVFQPMRGLTLSAAAAYIHARFGSFPGAQCFTPLPTGGNSALPCDASGNSLPRAPAFTINFNPRYEFQAGAGKLALSANVFRSSKIFYDFANNFPQKEFTLVNGQISYQLPNGLTFSLVGQNLTNNPVAQTVRAAALATDVLRERPRRIIFGVAYTF